jgi:hypothetical protein
MKRNIQLIIIYVLMMHLSINICFGQNKEFLNNNSIDTQNKEKNNWEKKLNLYNKTKNKYFRTIVAEKPVEAITSYLNENNYAFYNYFNNKIKEFELNNGLDLIYSIKEKEEIFINHNTNLGLKLKGFIKQQLSENLIIFNSGDLAFNLKNTSTIFLKLPQLEFNLEPNQKTIFNSGIYFPNFRLSISNKIYNCDSKRGSNFNASDNSTKEFENKISKSDIIYSLYDNKLKVLENEMKDGNCTYDIFTSNSKDYFLLKNKIYNINTLESINENINQKIYNLLRDTYNEPAYSFNDSNIVIYDKKNKYISLVNLHDTSKVKFINTKFFNRIDEINFMEIDKFSKYIYITYKLPYYFNGISDYGYINKRYKNSNGDYYHPKEMIVIENNSNKVVYLGPEISIDYTTEKLGYIMTKASFFTMKDSLIKYLKPGNATYEKYGFVWDYINASIPKYNDFNPAEYKNYGKRYLINLNPLLNDNFEEMLLNFEREFDKNNNNFFNDENSIKKQKIIFLDSLICHSFEWVKNTNKYSEEFSKLKEKISDTNLNIYSMYTKDSVEDKYEGEYTIDSINSIKYRISNQIDFNLVKLKKFVDKYKTEFGFLLKSSYLDSDIVKIIKNNNLKERDLDFLNSDKLKNYILVKDSIGYYMYYKILIEDAQLAKKINDTLSKNPFSIGFVHFYNPDANINCTECKILNNISNPLDIDNYIIEYCNSLKKIEKFKSYFTMFEGEDEVNPEYSKSIKFKDFNINEIDLFNYDSQLEESFNNIKYYNYY